MLGHLFGNLRNSALQKLTNFIETELHSVLDESNQSIYPKGYAQVNIRYIGVFQQVYRATLAIKYMVASCNTLICTKTSGD